MKEAAWCDERVLRWLDHHARVIDIDIESEREAAKLLAIDVAPTIVALKDDEEIHRIEGYRSPVELLDWFEGIDGGDKPIELVDRGCYKLTETIRADVQARMEVARDLALSCQGKQAADEYIAIWMIMRWFEPAMTGHQGASIVCEVQRLIKGSPAAERQLEAFRDDRARLLQAETVAIDDVRNWVALNGALNQEEVTLQWFDRIKSERRMKPLINGVSVDIRPLLIARGRWADVGRTLTDPMDFVESRRRIERGLAARSDFNATAKILTAHAFSTHWADQVGMTYAGLLAAGEEDEAEALAEKVREYFGTNAMNKGLVEWALKAGQARPEHVEWLTTEIVALRTRVEKALSERQGSEP